MQITITNVDLNNKARKILNNKLIMNALFMFGNNGVNSFFGFVFWAYAARFISPDQIGIASAVISAIVLIANIANFGLGYSVIRFLPLSDAPSVFLRTIVFVSLLLGLGIGVIFIVLIPLVSPNLAFFIAYPWFNLILFFFIIVVVLSNLLLNFFLAYRVAVYSLIHTGIINIVKIGLLFLLTGLNAIGLFVATLGAFFLADLFSFIKLVPKFCKDLFSCFELDFRPINRMINYSIANHIGTILLNIPMMISPLLALESIGEKSSAYIYIPWTISLFISSPGLSLGNSALVEGSHFPGKSRNILYRAMAYAIMVTIPLALLFGVGGEFILRFFGRDYVYNSLQLLRWLVVSSPFVVINGIYLSEFRFRKMNRELVFSTFIIASLAILVTLLLIYKVGIVASGHGYLISQVFGLFIIKLFLRNKTRVV